jgi:hypothetical protein
MATYLTLCNDVLVAINEVAFATDGSDFTSARGIQTTVKEAVNKAIHDVINEELEWPFNTATTTTTLIPGTRTYALPTGYRSMDWESFFLRPINEITNGSFASAITSWTDISAGSGTAAHTTDGDGRLRLTGDGTDVGAAEQSITVVANRQYKLLIRHLSNSVTINIGTASGLTDVVTTTATLTNAGEGAMFSKEFTPTTTSVFIGFANSSTTAVDVDFVEVRQNIPSRPVEYISFNTWAQRHKARDLHLDVTAFRTPRYIYPTHDDKFGVSPIPDQANYSVEYDYWASPSDLSAFGDTAIIPNTYKQVVTARARYYALQLRSDPAFADRANKEYEKGVKRMRSELINRPDYFKSSQGSNYNSSSSSFL